MASNQRTEDLAYAIGRDIGWIQRALGRLASDAKYSGTDTQNPSDTYSNLITFLKELPDSGVSDDGSQSSSTTGLSSCDASELFGFASARLPALNSLLESNEDNDYEAQIKRLTVNLFCDLLAKKAFDSNVLGAAQLGSFDLVQFSLARDGLALAQVTEDKSPIRYLYKAWMSRNNQGRGLHFFQTYLRLQFGGNAKAWQMWQRKSRPYPLSLRKRDDGQSFLTSRIAVEIGDDAVIKGKEAETASTIKSVMESILPARLIPVFYIAANDARVSESSLQVKAGYYSQRFESKAANFPIRGSAIAHVLAGVGNQRRFERKAADSGKKHGYIMPAVSMLIHTHLAESA